MKVAKITTKPVQPYDFLQLVFQSGASLLSPMILLPENLGLSPTMPIRLPDAFKMQELVTNAGWSTLGPAGLGQYSLIHQTSVFALAKLDVYLRQATGIEAMIDFDHFGDQIMGDKVKDKPRDAGKVTAFEFLGDQFYYHGPPRVLQANFTTRVENGLFPDLEVIKEVGKEIGKLATTLEEEMKFSDGMEEDGYYFVFADSGEIHVTKVMKLDDFPEFSKLQHVGHMEMQKRELFFIPTDYSGPPTDFSELIFKR
jgi:hypothetical protein